MLGVACFPYERVGCHKAKLVRSIARTIPNFREGCTIDRDVVIGQVPANAELGVAGRVVHMKHM